MTGPIDVPTELAALDAPWAARRPQLVALKHERMKEGAFPFLRASAPLFFRRLRESLAAARPPELDGLARWLEGDAAASPGRTTFCVGDVHVENFGAYRAPDGEERFGLNDFDDAVVAPLEVDVLRFATSVLVAARSAGGAPGPVAAALARTCLETYARELATAGPMLDPTTSDVGKEGPVRELLEAANEHSRQKFIDARAPEKKGKRGFVAGGHYRLLDATERASVLQAFERAVSTLPASMKPEQPGFYRAIDVAGRTAGLGSLGCGRYAVLVEGKGGDNGSVLLELKEAKPVALGRLPGPPLRAFEDEAARVIAGQLAVRSGRAYHLGRATLDGAPYYLHRLSHLEERVDFAAMGANPKVLGPVVEAEARALARAHARARVSLGERPLEPVSEGERRAWTRLAFTLAGTVEADYLAFCA